MRVLEPEERMAGGSGGLFGRVGRNVASVGGEKGVATETGSAQGTGEGDEEETARQRQRTGKRVVIKDLEVVCHLHSLSLRLCCLLLLFSASAAVDTRTRAGMP